MKNYIPNSVVLILLFILSALLIGQFSSLMHEIFGFLDFIPRWME